MQEQFDLHFCPLFVFQVFFISHLVGRVAYKISFWSPTEVCYFLNQGCQAKENPKINA